jgi:hypothetical protein
LHCFYRYNMGIGIPRKVVCYMYASRPHKTITIS